MQTFSLRTTLHVEMINLQMKTTSRCAAPRPNGSTEMLPQNYPYNHNHVCETLTSLNVRLQAHWQDIDGQL
eukprot:1752146-Pleurochrysis_carterae.AAC.1